MLKRKLEVQTIAEAPDLDSLRKLLPQFRPDWRRVDWRLPGNGCLLAEMKIIVLSVLPEDQRDAVEVGAWISSIRAARQIS